jgi:hypothetical protein
MFSRAGLLFLTCVILLSACGTAKKAAVTSFRVLDAPARYVRERLDEDEGRITSTTTTTQVTDVQQPGYPVVQPTPPPRRTVTSTQVPPRQTTSTTTRPPAAATPRPQVTAQFPTARPVPGRAGYVYSIDPNGGIVDVTGYKSGDKAKDPYTQQIFIVP